MLNIAHGLREVSDTLGEEGHAAAESLWTSLFFTVYREIRAIAIPRSSGTQCLKIE